VAGLFDLIKEKMTDDQGLFQGGKDGRMFGRARDVAEAVPGKMRDDQGLFQGGYGGRTFGRARDAWDKNAARNMGDTGHLAGQAQPGTFGYERPTPDKPFRFFDKSTWGDQSTPGSQQGDAGYKQADSWMKNFNPQDKNDVLKIQKMFGLEEDGVFGPKTLAAVRGFQNSRPGASGPEAAGAAGGAGAAAGAAATGGGSTRPTFKGALESGPIDYLKGNQGYVPDDISGGMGTRDFISDYMAGNQGYIPDFYGFKPKAAFDAVANKVKESNVNPWDYTIPGMAMKGYRAAAGSDFANDMSNAAHYGSRDQSSWDNFKDDFGQSVDGVKRAFGF
tara:strand:- start:725 stop:1723 length:999 start_codon:yes stop_codon:yes gene_type:complete